jgi:GT2 family glycosyltransferase
MLDKMAKPRVLHVITVYNGKAFVPDAIKSALRFDNAIAETDVLVLDDKSPAPGWSEELKKFCKDNGARYYCTPRNLGIPRNVSLGLLTAVKENYDYVTINNSDVIFPKNLINIMVEACNQPKVGSVTAWSNNVSIYTLANSNPDELISTQPVVDFISDTLATKNGSNVLDIPAGISFCIMMPIQAVKDVGLMDPIFGRGYCEETDWSLRSLKAGYRLCLAPGAFVYHQGRGSNLAAGLVSAHHTTVPENEDIIDMRYPSFRKDVAAFEAKPDMANLKREAIATLIDTAAYKFGYCVELGWQKARVNKNLDMTNLDMVRAEILPDNMASTIKYSYRGFEELVAFDGDNPMKDIVARFGTMPALSAMSRAAELKLLHDKNPILLKTATNGYPFDVWAE